MRRIIAIAACGAGLVSTSIAASKNSWDNPPKQRMAGLQHRVFQSASVRASVGYNICLPPEYDASKNRFPVIYYLHGYQGNESSYLDYANYWRQSLTLGHPTILVFVNGGEASFFCDAPDGATKGETVVKELISHIDQNYRTLARREGRSLHGYSMGGFGALKLAFKQSDMFGSVVAYGATLSTAEQMKKHLGKVYAKTFGSDKARFDAENPFTLLERNAEQIRRNVRVQILIGSKDEFLPANRQLHERLKALGVRSDFQEIPGAEHKKEEIYDEAASRGFAFTMKNLP